MTGMGVGNSLNTNSNALTPTSNVLMTAGIQPFNESGVQITVAHNQGTHSSSGGRSSPSSNITNSSTNSGTSRSVPRSATRANPTGTTISSTNGRSAVAEAAALDAMNEAAGRHTVVDALAMLHRAQG